MCENEPRFVLHGTEGSYVKYGLDPQEADLTKGLLSDAPHWGVEDESQWGILHTEKMVMWCGNLIRPENYILSKYERAYIRVRRICNADLYKRWL